MPYTYLLPLEIKETIIDFLAEDVNNHSHSALKTCSLVCQAFLPICRKHIFGSIALGGYNGPLPTGTPHALGRLLSERPEIANYIRKLDYNIQAHLIDPSIPESLTRISRLESLTVRNCYGRGIWSNHPIRPTLLHLLHLPTLTHFKTYRINDFEVWDLIPCVNLKHLDFNQHTSCATETTFPATFPKHPIQLNEFEADTGSAMAIMKLCTARRPDGQSLITFRSLCKITVVLEMFEDGEASQELLGRCEMLAEVDITFRNPKQVRPSLANMLRPSMQTLKHITVIVHVDDVDDDPLFGIPSELEDMRIKNIIESLTIQVIVGPDGNCSRGEDWGRLDEVLTSSGWFALKEVSLAIEIDTYLPGLWPALLEREVALRDLPERQFPRLSKSKFVSFHFDVYTEPYTELV